MFGLEYPIVCAGMGGVALAELAAAVSEAGGLGTLGLAALGREGILSEITAARNRTKKPLAVNLLVPFLRPGLIDLIADTSIQAVTLFWDDARQHADSIARLHRASIKVIWQCGSADEARWAKDAGADAVIAQGFEAGGHVRGEVTTFALIPEVRDAIGDLPMLAAGGISDGRGLAAVLALGADGAVFGTRFLGSMESVAHPRYKERILRAHASETMHTILFDIGWPDAPHRVLRTGVVDQWEQAGRPASGQRPGEGETIAVSRRPDVEIPLVNYSVMPPADYLEGEVDALPFYAGQSCTMVREIAPAGEIVRRIAAEASDVIAKRLAAMLR